MQDELYMRRCLDLASKGAGFVSPNPLVGCVIVHNNKIIGEGYHAQYGQAHAEVNAVQSVKNKELLKTSTLYVNLEPCAHFGKTPPCANLIVEAKIPRVVIGSIDPYSEVAGKGIESLKAAGVQVKLNILKEDCLELNKRFFTFHNKKRPYVILKWAQSTDGFIDIDRNHGTKGQFWITAPETKQLVHKWRHEEAGILVGKNTVINDNPSLTVTEFDGRSPVRFILDRNDSIQLNDYKIGKEDAQTFKISGKNCEKAKDILDFIASKNIISVLVEGGKQTLDTFLESGTWDEARVLTGKNEISSGQKAPTINKPSSDSYFFGDDLIQIFVND